MSLVFPVREKVILVLNTASGVVRLHTPVHSWEEGPPLIKPSVATPPFGATNLAETVIMLVLGVPPPDQGSVIIQEVKILT